MTLFLIIWSAIAVGFALHGKGAAGVIILCWLVPPVAVYRSTMVDRAKSLWRDLEVFSQNGGKLPLRGVFWFAVLPLVFLSLLNGRSISSFDNLPVNLTSASLVLRGDTNAIDFVDVKREGDACLSAKDLAYSLRCIPKGVYSNYPAGMVVFATPVFALARFVGADLHQGLVTWRLAKFTSAWIAGTSLGLFLLLALRLGSARGAMITTIFLAVGSTMLSSVGQGLWSNSGVLFWLLTALVLEEYFAKYVWVTLLQGICVGLMLACRLNAGLMIVPLSLWLFSRHPKRVFLYGAGVLLAYAPFALYQYQIYGNALGPQFVMGTEHHWGENLSQNILGVLISPARGIFIYQPWLILLAVWLVPKIRHQVKSRAFYCMIVAASFLQIAVVVAWFAWWGGTCWGSRLLTEMIPLAALLIIVPVSYLDQQKHGRRILLAIGILSFLMHLPYVFMNANHWSGNPTYAQDVHLLMMDWTEPPFLYPFQEK